MFESQSSFDCQKRELITRVARDQTPYSNIQPSKPGISDQSLELVILNFTKLFNQAITCTHVHAVFKKYQYYCKIKKKLMITSIFIYANMKCPMKISQP